MRHTVGRIVIVTTALAALALIAAGAGAVSNALKPPTPPLIATVNLEVVFNSLHERFTRDEAREARKNQLNEKIKQLKATFDDTKKKLEQATPAEQGPLRETLQRLGFDADNEVKFSEQALDNMRGEALAAMYEKIAESAAQLAKKSGYTMVAADDQGAKIILSGTNDVVRQIALKRMLYIDSAHDITPELITSMNNDWIAKGGKPAPPPPAAGAPANNNGAPKPAPAKPGGG